jgi:N-acetylmuramoyl-L-alanine amidase
VIAVCVGHSRTWDRGAESIDGTTERVYNADLAGRMVDRLASAGVEARVIKAYPAAMRWLAGELRRLEATCAVELHFNWSHVGAATGHEWLYWGGSEPSRLMARCLNAAMKDAYPWHLARGVKAAGAKDNGAGFLRSMPCPAVIAEPFFGSNRGDWETVAADADTLARELATGLIAFREMTTHPKRKGCGK